MPALFRLLALSLLLGLALPIAANEKIGKDDFDAQREVLQLKIDNGRELVEKSLDGFKSRIDALDKRLDDQNNRVGDIGQSVDRFSVIVGSLGIIVTLLLASGGLIGYFSVTRKVAEEAKSASQKWFDDNQNKLAGQIHELEKAAEQAHKKIDNSVNDVELHSNAAIEQMQTGLNTSDEQAQPISPIEQQALQQSAEQIREKPEASYSFQDWNKRAFDAYRSEQYEDAALYWKHASSIPNAGATNTAQALLNRAIALNQLKRHVEVCATYKQLISTYSSDNTPAIRELVGNAMFGEGVVLGKMQKQDEAIATYEKLIAAYSSDNTPAIREVVAKATSNMGAALMRMQKPAEAVAAYEKLIATYSSDDTPAIRDLVANAFNGKGFVRLMEAKKAWKDSDRAVALLREAQADLLACRNLRPNFGIALGNLAYVQWLLGDKQAAEESFRAALAAAQNGGKALYLATLDDIAMHSIEEDSAFRSMVERQRAEYQTANSSDD